MKSAAVIDRTHRRAASGCVVQGNARYSALPTPAIQVVARTNLHAAPASYRSLHIGGMQNWTAWAQQRWWGLGRQ